SSSFFAMRQMAQTFTPRLTGQLDHIALWEGSGNGTAQNFQLQVWTVDTTKTALTPVAGNIPTYQLRGDVNRTQHGWDLVPSVSITAAPGSVTQAGPNSHGTWTWTGTAADEDVPVQTVTITANDHHNPAVSTTFTVEFYAVKPTATITPAAPTSSLLAAASRPKEGQLLSFTGSAHSQSAADNSGPWTYSWSVTKD